MCGCDFSMGRSRSSAPFRQPSPHRCSWMCASFTARRRSSWPNTKMAAFQELTAFLSRFTALLGTRATQGDVLLAVRGAPGLGFDQPGALPVMQYAFLAYPLYNPRVQTFVRAQAAIEQLDPCDAGDPRTTRPPFILQVATRQSALAPAMEELDVFTSDSFAELLLNGHMRPSCIDLLQYEETNDAMKVKVTNIDFSCDRLQAAKGKTNLDDLPQGDPLSSAQSGWGRARARGRGARGRGKPQQARSRSRATGGAREPEIDLRALPDASHIDAGDGAADEIGSSAGFNLEEALARHMEMDFPGDGLEEILRNVAEDPTAVLEIFEAVHADNDVANEGVGEKQAPEVASASSADDAVGRVVDAWLHNASAVGDRDGGSGVASSQGPSVQEPPAASSSAPPPELASDPLAAPSLVYGDPDEPGGTYVTRDGVPIGRLQAKSPGDNSISISCFLRKSCGVMVSRRKYGVERMARWLAMGEACGPECTPVEKGDRKRRHKEILKNRPMDV